MQIKIEHLLALPIFLDGSDGSMWTETNPETFARLRNYPLGETAHSRYVRFADVAHILRNAGVLRLESVAPACNAEGHKPAAPSQDGKAEPGQ